MKRSLIILNHAPVKGVYQDLLDLGCDDVKLLSDINPELAKRFANVGFNEAKEIAKEIVDVIIGSGNIDFPEYEIIIISGEPRVCSNVYLSLGYGDEQGRCNSPFKCKLYSPYSKRISIDEPQKDGSVRKVVKFQYEGLAPY